MQSNASFAEAVRVAYDSLRSSKLRSFLTLLGIILATTTLIAVMSVIHGMNVYIADNVSSMGADGFRVVRMAFVGRFDPKKFVEMQKKNPELTSAEFEFLKSRATLLQELGMSSGRQVNVSYRGDQIQGVSLSGVSTNFATLNNTDVARGRFFADVEDRRHMEVAFLGNDLKERFFPNVDPIGKMINVAGRPFQVVGVAKPKGSVFGQSQDMFVYIPIETYFKIYSSRTGISYVARARSQAVLEQAEDQLRQLVRAWRHLRPAQDDNFSVVSSDSLVTAFQQLTGAIAATAVAVVSVFMVVGGVVIMNIMLAVVTERTREIGIRKSVGARRQDILNQFLVESAMLSGSGGLLGVGIAWAVSTAVRYLTPVPTAVPASAVVIAVFLSTAVGLFFGIYPARQAARLDPIEALRAEA